MKVLFQDYTFNAATKQITFNTTDVVSLNQVLVITNVTDNIIIYNFADPAKGGTILNNVLTLTFDTTTMSNTDSLQIFLDLYGTPSTEETTVLLNESVVLLRKMVKLMEPLGTQDTQQRQRISLDAAPVAVTVAQATASQLNVNVGTVTTITTLNNLALIAGIDPRFQFIDQAKIAFATGIRNNLTY
jgi:hypothetical protein